MNVLVKIQRKYGYIPRQQLLGVDDRDLDEEDVGQELPDFSHAVLLAAADQDLGLLGAVDQDDPRLVQLGDEPRQVLDRDRLRPVLPLERLLDLLRVCLPSNCWSRKYSSILKRKYLSARGSLMT